MEEHSSRSGSPPSAQAAEARLFIVHAEQDQAFVEGFLLEALALPADAVLLSSGLEPGAPIVEEIERGVLSPVTVVVLSPAFLDSRWARFAELLAQTQSVEAAASGSSTLVPAIVADCELPLLLRFRVTLDFRNPDREHWEAEAAKLRKRLEAPAPVATRPSCPYPGMRPFAASDAGSFHGREREVDELLACLRGGERELYVIGSSGSGKSSILAAGLIPRLERSSERVKARFLVRTLRPGAEPVAALAGALGVTAEADGRTELASAIAGLLAGAGDHDRLLLVIDQLEELFASAGREAQAAFFAAIRELRGHAWVVLIFVLRSDFYGALMDSELAADRDGSLARLDVRPLSEQQLGRAIEAPARAVGVSLEPGLVRELVRDAASEPGTLPLLQETLVYLWERLARRLLRLADYQAMGEGSETGLAVTVQRLADGALAALSSTQASVARRVFLRLVQFGEGRPDTRRQQPRSAFAACGDAADVEAVLDHFVGRRLLMVTGGDGPAARVDLAHEILLSAWPTLRDWTRERRSEEQRRRALEAKASEWSTRCADGRSDVGLLDDGELVELDGWLTPEVQLEIGVSAEAQALVRASRAAAAARVAEAAARVAEATARVRRGRQVRNASIVVLGGVAAAMLALALYARGQAGQAERARVEATRQLGENLLEQGRQALVVDERPLQAISYLTAARERGLDGVVLRTLFAQAARNLWLVRFEHAGAVESARFSADGTRVVTASKDKTARVWDAATGRAVTPPLAHDRAVVSASFSADGTRVVTASADGTARVWDASTGGAVAPPLRHGGRVSSAWFSSDGTRVVTASKDGTARVWDASTGRAVTPPLPHAGEVYSAKFSADGTLVVTASEDKTAQVWDAATGRAVTPPLAHGNDVHSAGFSADGTRVVTASRDHTARVWDAATGRAVTPPLAHGGQVRSAAFSADGTRVVTASEDGTARVWDAATGRAVTQPLAHDRAVRSAQFSADGTWVVTASDDGAARVWDATGRAVTPPLAHGGQVRSAAFSADGTRVVTASADGTARVWDATGRAVTPPLAHVDLVWLATFNADGTRVVTASKDGTARVWDAATGRAVTPPLAHAGAVRSAAFSADGTRVVTASHKTARVWDAGTGRAVTPPLAHAGAVRSASFSADGTQVVTASEDKTARVWDARTGRAVTPPLVHAGAVRSAWLSADGTRLVTAGRDWTARVWDARMGRVVTPPLAHNGPVTSAWFSGDGTRVVTASADKTARVWDAATGRALTPPLAHAERVHGARFSGDGARVVTASADKTARVWDAATGRALTPPLAHDAGVRSAWFSGDGTRVVTASGQQARVWDAATGRALTPPLAHAGAVTSASFSGDGTRVVTASEDETARIWDVSPSTLPLQDWQRLADAYGDWTPSRAPKAGTDAAALGRRLAREHCTAACDLVRASNLLASAYAQLPHFPATARTFAAEAAALYARHGRDELAAAQTCLATIAVLEHDLAGARRARGAAAPATEVDLVRQLASEAEEETQRPALAQAILDAAAVPGR